MGNDCTTCKYRLLSMFDDPCADCYRIESLADGYKYTNYEPKEGIENNPVSHPNHYQSKSGLEVIDVIKAFTEDLKGVESYYTGNILKYMFRWKKKNGVEDLKKARQYLDWLIDMEDPSMTEEGKDVLSKFKDIWDSLPEDTKEYAKSLANEEKKEPPKNGRYSMSDDDCFVPWKIRPNMVPTYPVPGPCSCCDAYARSKEETKTHNSNDLVEMIWIEFCRSFCEALKEVSEEEKEKENKKDEK